MAASMQIPVAEAVQYEPMSRMGILAVPANIPSQSNFKRYDRHHKQPLALSEIYQACRTMLLSFRSACSAIMAMRRQAGKELMFPSTKPFLGSRSFTAIPRHTVMPPTDLRWVVASTMSHAAET
jgi:hypothetical protein